MPRSTMRDDGPFEAVRDPPGAAEVVVEHVAARHGAPRAAFLAPPHPRAPPLDVRVPESRRERRNILASGGASTGRTTPLRVLADHQRLLVPEDTPEIALAGDNVVHLHTTFAVDLAALLRQGLRMRPDRIAPGEVRRSEALELVWTTDMGHDGRHAGDAARQRRARGRPPPDMPVAEARPAFPAQAIAGAVDHVLRLAGRGGRRRLAETWPVPEPRRAADRTDPRDAPARARIPAGAPSRPHHRQVGQSVGVAR